MNPDIHFTTSLFNINPDMVESFTTNVSDDSVIYEITLKRQPASCPYCRSMMIGHGHKTRKINHPALRNRNCIPVYCRS